MPTCRLIGRLSSRHLHELALVLVALLSSVVSTVDGEGHECDPSKMVVLTERTSAVARASSQTQVGDGDVLCLVFTAVLLALFSFARPWMYRCHDM